MLPSQQSLEADNVSGGEVDNRLVKIAKLFPLEGMTEIRFNCNRAITLARISASNTS